MKKKVSMVIPFDTMKENIRNGEHWVRTDWTKQDKYVIIADDRYCTPCLLLDYRLSVSEYIEKNDIDIVLVSYGAANFASDSSIVMAAS